MRDIDDIISDLDKLKTYIADHHEELESRISELEEEIEEKDSEIEDLKNQIKDFELDNQNLVSELNDLLKIEDL